MIERWRLFRIIIVFQFGIGFAGFANAQSKCPTDLSYLDKRLPNYPSDSEYSKVREAVIHQSITQALSAARAQGLSTATAADQALQQADEADRTQTAMADVARAYSSTVNELTLQQLRQGTYPTAGRPLPAPLGGYVAGYGVAIAAREIAAAFACLARQGR